MKNWKISIVGAGLLMLIPFGVLAHPEDEAEHRANSITRVQAAKSQDETKSGATGKNLAKVQALSAERLAKLDSKRKERCERIQAKLQQKVAKAEQHQSSMDQRYTVVETRWQRLIDRAKVLSVDTAKLEAALTEYKAKHTDFNTDLTALRELQSATTASCDDAVKIAVANNSLKTARDKVLADASALRKLRQDTHRTTVVTLLKSMAKARGGSSAESTKTEKQ